MKEEQMILVEKDYKSLQEEVDEQWKLMKILWTKYKEAVDEIKDLSNEHFKEKEFLLETIRDLEKDSEFFKTLV